VRVLRRGLERGDEVGDVLVAGRERRIARVLVEVTFGLVERDRG